MKRPMKAIIVVMGVSGCGKSTLGQAIASALQLPFIEGDDFHPDSNVAKMSEGIPLQDEDRASWLSALHDLAKSHLATGAVLACSALKESYRQQLSAGMTDSFLWILPEGTYEEIHGRMRARSDHFMPPALLISQFETLEIPDYAFRVAVGKSTAEQLEASLDWIQKKAPGMGA